MTWSLAGIEFSSYLSVSQISIVDMNEKKCFSPFGGTCGFRRSVGAFFLGLAAAFLFFLPACFFGFGSAIFMLAIVFATANGSSSTPPLSTDSGKTIGSWGNELEAIMA